MIIAIGTLMPGNARADDAATISLEGRLKHPVKLSLADLRKMPAEQSQITSERGSVNSYTGVRLWALLSDAGGGIDDADKSAVLHHVIRITARDGYFIVISTGEIAPDFGGKPALIAYLQDDKPLGEAAPRLVMPGDKRGGRNVREVATISVE